MDAVVKRALASLSLALLAGCIGTGPEQARYDELIRLGADDDGDEEHNPGFPCADCHGRDYAPGGDVFALAGTVYAYASDPDDEGRAGIVVHVRDARGREADAVTNAVGNFMFEVEDEGGDGAERGEDGRARLGYWPEPPLTVWITDGDVEQRMETPVRREASCAGCHFREPGVDSVGRVYLMEAP